MMLMTEYSAWQENQVKWWQRQSTWAFLCLEVVTLMYRRWAGIWFCHMIFSKSWHLLEIIFVYYYKSIYMPYFIEISNMHILWKLVVGVLTFLSSLKTQVSLLAVTIVSIFLPTENHIKLPLQSHFKTYFCSKFRYLSQSYLCSQKMLQHLKDKKDVGFFTSVSGLMQQCR